MVKPCATPAGTSAERTFTVPAGFTGISVRPESRDALTRFQALAGGQLARRLNTSDALRLACHLAEAHLTDVTTAAQALGLLDPPSNGATS